jgi:hypothetical protein
MIVAFERYTSWDWDPYGFEEIEYKLQDLLRNHRHVARLRFSVGKCKIEPVWKPQGQLVGKIYTAGE